LFPKKGSESSQEVVGTFNVGEMAAAGDEGTVALLEARNCFPCRGFRKDSIQ
jgi:hypothetical protein